METPTQERISYLLPLLHNLERLLQTYSETDSEWSILAEAHSYLGSLYDHALAERDAD